MSILANIILTMDPYQTKNSKFKHRQTNICFFKFNKLKETNFESEGITS